MGGTRWSCRPPSDGWCAAILHHVLSRTGPARQNDSQHLLFRGHGNSSSQFPLQVCPRLHDCAGSCSHVFYCLCGQRYLGSRRQCGCSTYSSLPEFYHCKDVAFAVPAEHVTSTANGVHLCSVGSGTHPQQSGVLSCFSCGASASPQGRCYMHGFSGAAVAGAA